MFEQARDLLTKELFIKKRSNQKFANPQNRIRFNNLKAQKKRADKAPFEKPLDQNRTVLKKILGENREKVLSKDYLLGAGFSFGYFTYHKKVDDSTYAGIYEYGITKLSDEKFKIIKFNDGQAS